MEKTIDTENHVSWADVVAAEKYTSQNFADDVHPAATLRALMASEDSSATASAQVEEQGAPLSAASLRVLRLAHGDNGLSNDERARLEEAERREKVDRAIALSEQIQSASKPPSAEELIRRFMAGDRDFTRDEMDLMWAAIQKAKAEQGVDFSTESDGQVRERLRKEKLAELHEVATAVTNGIATPAQLVRWKRFDKSAFNKAMSNTKFADLPWAVVANF